MTWRVKFCGYDSEDQRVRILHENHLFTGTVEIKWRKPVASGSSSFEKVDNSHGRRFRDIKDAQRKAQNKNIGLQNLLSDSTSTLIAVANAVDKRREPM